MPTSSAARAAEQFTHLALPSGVEFAAEVLPARQSVAMAFRVLAGVADDPEELIGLGSIVERTLSKGTARYTGQELADAFDALGAQWSSTCGRQSTVVRAVCLPEFTADVIDLVAEMICRPTFPEDACKVAVELAQEELRHMQDEPQALLHVAMQKLAFGPIWGRHAGGEMETLARITRSAIERHWRELWCSGRLQVALAGPIDVQAVARRVDESFRGFGAAARAGRVAVDYALAASRSHQAKDLKQQYIGLSLPGLARGHADFAVEQVALGVLSGGMSARLFTEVREKLALVYWVGAWHEQPRGVGALHLGASTTPERCKKTYETLLRELRRLGEDLTEEETERARNSLIAHMQTEDDLTRARAGNLSDDLFHFGRPVGSAPKLEALNRVTTRQVEAYARAIDRKRLCVTTIGPAALE